MNICVQVFMGSYVFCFLGYVSRSEIAILFKTYTLVFPVSSVGKESICNVGDPSSNPGLGRSAGEFQGLYSPWGRKEVDTTEQLSLSLECLIKSSD